MQEKLRKKNEKALGDFRNRPKYGGMIRGYGGYYDLPYATDKPRATSSSFHIGGKPYSELVGKKAEEEDFVEIDPRDFPKDDTEPTFSSKIEEEIWRLKNKK